jgi:hypothetical protein
MSLQRVIAMPAIAACLLLSGLSRAHGTEVAARDQPARWITDSAITVAVTTKLAAQHFSQVTRLKVQTDKGGVVFSAEPRQAAARPHERPQSHAESGACCASTTTSWCGETRTNVH